MEKEVSKITKVEIKKLWGRYDLVWNLHPDVNVLSGINGSGKSSILDCIFGLLSNGEFSIKVEHLFEKIIIEFDNMEYMDFVYFIDSQKNSDYILPNASIVVVLNTEDKNKLENKNIYFGLINFANNYEFLNLPKTCKISTFDTEILGIEKPDKEVHTVLDREIFTLQKRYLDFQLNIGKKVIEAISKGNNAHTQEEVAKIRQQQERFLEIIDHLFKDTDKKINRQKNEIMFLFGDKELTPYQLSSGEKQILVILLTLLVQDNQYAIVFLDEPEVSLHFDWQKKLIQYMRELNPNAQIIIATHSPALIIEGWRDKVTDVKDIIVKDHSKSAN
jgi:energy-coupling factor transporter ATP-binding protein EcfA2